MIEIVPFKMEHAEGIVPELRSFELDSIFSRHDGIPQFFAWCEHMSKYALMSTFMLGDRVAAIFASLKINETTAEIWAFTGRAVDDDVRGFWSASVRGLDAYLESQKKITRLQCHVDERHVKSRAWIERLGFRCETPFGLANYGQNNETFFLYAMTGGANG